MRRWRRARSRVSRAWRARAASAEFSTQAIAGTVNVNVNVILKKTASKRQRDVRINLTQSAETRSVNLLGTVADRSDNMSYFLSGSVGRSYNEGNGQITQQLTSPAGALLQYREGNASGGTYATGVSLQPRLSWNLANDDQPLWSASVQASRSNGSSRTDYDAVIGSFGTPDYRMLTTGNTSSACDFSSNLNWIAKIAGGKLDAKVSLWNSKVESGVRLHSSTADRLIDSDRNADSTSHFSYPRQQWQVQPQDV